MEDGSSGLFSLPIAGKEIGLERTGLARSKETLIIKAWLEESLPKELGFVGGQQGGTCEYSSKHIAFHCFGEKLLWEREREDEQGGM